MRYSALLTDLPIPVRVDGLDISDEYINELKNVGTEEELEKFTKRWKAVWNLPYRRGELNEFEEAIVTNTYDKSEALICIKDGRDSGCSHTINASECVGSYILLPPIFLVSFLTSKKYDVPIMAAFV